METGIIIVAFIIICAVIASVASAAGSQRFHESGEAVHPDNEAQYGQPSKSLYCSSPVLSLNHAIEVTDDKGQVHYRAESDFISLHDYTRINDAFGNRIAEVERKSLSFHEIHYVHMADGTEFTLSNELFHLVKDITNVEGLGWRLQGNFLEMNFQILDQQANVLAVIGQKLFSIHDKYSVDIYDPQQEQKIIAILITLQHLIRDRENSRTSSASANS